MADDFDEEYYCVRRKTREEGEALSVYHYH